MFSHGRVVIDDEDARRLLRLIVQVLARVKRRIIRGLFNFAHLQKFLPVTGRTPPVGLTLPVSHAGRH